MFYKLSNTCEICDIETELGISFRYPNIYKPKPIIHGLSESNLPIITSEKPEFINFAIWGLLPENYDDNWHDFQDFTNTLNTNIDDPNLNEEIYSKSLDKRRCLIIVNGFFASKLIDGKLKTHHIRLTDNKPFCLAGIYNKIHDGFLTCSLLMTTTGIDYKVIPHLGKQKPIILKSKDYETWLNPKFGISQLRTLIHTHDRYDFVSHPVKKDHYQDLKVFKQIVNSNNYESMMHVIRDE